MSATFPIAFGRYKLVERLAIGGMAELYLGEVGGDHGFAKKVVIKRILPHLAADPNFTTMFIAEAKITARLSHPRIAQTHRLGREEGQLYIEMEYVDGLDVLAMLRECAHRRVRLPPEVSAYVIKEVLDGLDYAHRLTDDSGDALGLVHRDVSPSNILVSRRGNVKLVDFGIAHAAAVEQQTQAGTLKGKYGYMSPEQVLGEGVSPQSDLFSVGVVLAEMLMGRRLFAAPNELDVLLMVRDVNLGRLERYGAHVPPALDQIVRRALKKLPGERFHGGAEFRDALDEWMFENRMRVTPSGVGQLVESLYEDAHSRRRANLEEAAPPGIGEPMMMPAVAASGEMVVARQPRRESLPPQSPPRVAAQPVPASRVRTDKGPGVAVGGERPFSEPGMVDGIPSGRSLVLGSAEAPSDEEIELAFGALRDGDTSGSEVPARAQGPTGVAAVRTGSGEKARTGSGEKVRPAPERDDDLVLSEEIVVDLDGLERIGAGGPPQHHNQAPLTLTDEDVESTLESGLPSGIPKGLVTDDDGIPISVEDSDHSARFPTISAAVASVSPPKRDPASRDFDDSDVSGVAEVALEARSGKFRLPTAQEIARTPKPRGPTMDEITETPAQQGDLGKTSPIKVFFQLVSSRADGLLVVSVGGIRKEIYIKDGMPTYVSSNMASELFGAYLVQEGAVSSGELDMALAMMPHFGGKLGDTLVGLGLMKPLDVFRLLTRQVRQKLIDVCTWNKGTYTWYPWRENHRESFPLDLDPYEVLGAGAMALPEDVLWRWSESVSSVRPRASARASVRPEQFKVGPIGPSVLQGLSGERTISDLIVRGLGDIDRLDMLRLVFLFLETGLVADSAG
ncbi:MAG TPA: serine/threonine-protein kinase [Kofleriaceae bacterium]